METILRVILRTDGEIHIVVTNGQTVVCTLSALVDLLMNPRSFAAKGYSFYNISTLYINPKNESMSSVFGVTLLSATSDNRIICEFPHLFEILFSNMEAPVNVPMYSSLEAFSPEISDEKELLLAAFLLMSKLRTSDLLLSRQMDLTEDFLVPIFKEIVSAHLSEMPVKPKPTLAERSSEQTLQLVLPSEAKPTLVSIREYADTKNVSYQNVLNWCRNGNLITAHKDEKNKWRIDINDTPLQKRVPKKKPESRRGQKVRTPNMPYEDVQKFGRAKK